MKGVAMAALSRRALLGATIGFSVLPGVSFAAGQPVSVVATTGMIGHDVSSIERDAMDFHQFSQRTGVFCRQHICRCQHVQRTQRDIASCPDGRADKVQPGGQFEFVVIQRWTALS